MHLPGTWRPDAEGLDRDSTHHWRWIATDSYSPFLHLVDRIRRTLLYLRWAAVVQLELAENWLLVVHLAVEAQGGRGRGQADLEMVWSVQRYLESVRCEGSVGVHVGFQSFLQRSGGNAGLPEDC